MISCSLSPLRSIFLCLPLFPSRSRQTSIRSLQLPRPSSRASTRCVCLADRVLHRLLHDRDPEGTCELDWLSRMKRPGDDDNPQESHFALLPHEESGERVDHDGNEPEMMARDGQGEKRNIELEYETPNTIKFLWLGTYFFFSLMLTLYNKLVLGSVRIDFHGRVHALQSGTNASISIVQVPMAVDQFTRDLRLSWDSCPAEAGLLQALALGTKRACDTSCIFGPVHSEHCRVQSVAVRPSI